jgi:hypothetical protein
MGFFGKIMASTPLSHQASISEGLAGKILLMQQRASVDMIRSMVSLGRADVAELENAERRLAELEGLAPPAPNGGAYASPHVGNLSASRCVNHQVPEEQVQALRQQPTMMLSAELMSQIDKLNRKRAEACNAMHDVPKDQDCPELMAMAVAIHNELEDVWTKYRYLERNGKLPDEETEKAKEVSLELLQKMDERKKLGEKRTKLNKKITDPYNHKNKKLEEWKEEYDFALLRLKDLDDEIYLLKNR